MHKWIMAGLLGVACVMAVIILLVNMPESESTNEEVADNTATIEIPDREVDEEAAMLIYTNSCLACHGDELQGVVGPALSNIGGTLSKEEIYHVISEGRGGMPAFGQQLSEDELITITTWLASKE